MEEEKPIRVERRRFPAFARRLAALGGHTGTFFAGVGLVVMWLVTDPGFRSSDTWQLVINTTTSLVALLMVFLIQGRNRQV